MNIIHSSGDLASHTEAVPDWPGLLPLEPRLLMAANPGGRIRVLDTSVAEGDAGTTTLSFTVRRTGPANKVVNVRYITDDAEAGDLATEGVDYEAASGKIKFRKGDRIQTIDVTVNGDVDAEEDEIFNLLLTKATGKAVVARGEAVGTITDDDTPPTLSIDDPTVVEGNAGTVNLVFTVTLSAASDDPVTVDYATSDGTATAGVDYTADTDTLTFNAGITTQTITIVVDGDAVAEGDETLLVTLTNPTNATILDDEGTGTITDDD